MAYAFVDDIDLIETAKYLQDNSEEALLQMQPALTLWNGMIRATRGELGLEKTLVCDKRLVAGWRMGVYPPKGTSG